MRLGLALGFLASLLAATTASAAAPFTPWCGNGQESPADRPDAVPAFRVHVVYAVPVEGTDRFAQLVSLIATDTATVDL